MRSKLTRAEAMECLRNRLSQFYDDVGVPKKYGRPRTEDAESLYQELVEMDDEIWAGIMDFKDD